MCKGRGKRKGDYNGRAGRQRESLLLPVHKGREGEGAAAPGGVVVRIWRAFSPPPLVERGRDANTTSSLPLHCRTQKRGLGWGGRGERGCFPHLTYKPPATVRGCWNKHSSSDNNNNNRSASSNLDLHQRNLNCNNSNNMCQLQHQDSNATPQRPSPSYNRSQWLIVSPTTGRLRTPRKKVCKPRLPRQVAPSARINLNLYWDRLEEYYLKFGSNSNGSKRSLLGDLNNNDSSNTSCSSSNNNTVDSSSSRLDNATYASSSTNTSTSAVMNLSESLAATSSNSSNNTSSSSVYQFGSSRSTAAAATTLSSEEADDDASMMSEGED